MKNVKKLLIFVALGTFMFASSTRTDALGGDKFWADDYANITAFPASVNNHNVAYTNGSNFTTIFNQDGTTWGFTGGTGDDVANIMWGNGDMGVTFGLSMTPEVTAEDVTADATLTAADAETGYSIGFGMPLAGGDLGFTYDDSGMIGLNHRRAQDVWIWDNMVVGFDMIAEDTDAGTPKDMNLGVDCYTIKSYEGGTSALFGLGFAYGQMGDDDATMGIEWNFAVESEMTDWATLRVGYSHGYDFASGGVDVAGSDAVECEVDDNDCTPSAAVDQINGFTLGLGFNYGSFNLDMAVGSTEMFNNPVAYVTGRNASALGASWTISYNW